jgi:hypothetical protein
MLECLIIGDSIANGIKNTLHDCVSLTEIGISTQQWYKKYNDRPMLDMAEYQYTVISLGTNDAGEEGAAYMHRIRNKIKTKRAIWILPSDTAKPKQRAMIESVAAAHGDLVLSIKQWVGPDGIHPPTVRAYEQISKSIKDSD